MFPCLECGSTFQDSSNLRRHLRAVHNNEKPHVCTICDEKFARSDHLKRHVQRHERQPSSLVCGIGGCKRTFARETTLEDHRNLHNKKLKENVLHIKGHLVRKTSSSGSSITFTCPFEGCNRLYESYSGITKHLSRHSSEASQQDSSTGAAVVEEEEEDDNKNNNNDKAKPSLQCEICNQMFTRRSSVLKHQRRIHQKEPNNTDDSSSVVGFPCPYEGCAKIFSRRTNARAHVNNVHKGQQIFTCDSCSATFRLKRSLLRHRCDGITPGQQTDCLSSQHPPRDG